jgi:hypothetical protein
MHGKVRNQAFKGYWYNFSTDKNGNLIDNAFVNKSNFSIRIKFKESTLILFKV